MKRLVLLGGGHAHIEVLRDLAARPDSSIAATLVTPYPRLIYTGMAPGVIAGHYRLEEAAIDLAQLVHRAGATLVQASASLVSPVPREVLCAEGSIVPYDVLSIDVGSQPAIGQASGVEKHAIPMRPMERLMQGWGEVLEHARDGRVTAVTIVGGGAAGVELALAMDHRFRRDVRGAIPHVRIITETPTITAEFPPHAQLRLRRRLARRDIGVHTSSTVVEVGPRQVRLDNGMVFASDATFWAGGAAAPGWLRLSGFATDERGFLLTNDYLQSVTFQDVFGAGDCATQEGRALAKAGVFAVRAAPTLAANLRAMLAGLPLAAFVTTRSYLALVSCGRKYAVGVRGRFSWEGRWAWYWKNRIDRRFIEHYAKAPAPKA